MPEALDSDSRSSVQDEIDGRITFTDGTGTVSSNARTATVVPIVHTVSGAYYTTRGKKILDVMIGLSGLVILEVLYWVLFINRPLSGSGYMSWNPYLFMAILPIVLVALLSRLERYYIVIGVVSIYALPFLYIFIVFGSCFMPFR